MAREEGGPLSLDDVERAARATLPPEVWDFVAGGSGRELTLAENRRALDRIFVVPRVLRDVSRCGTTSGLLGKPVSMPLAIAPTAFHRLVHPDGEPATARAAKAAGVPFVASTMSSVPLEEVVRAGGSVWFQLYWMREREESFALVRRAEAAGAEAIVLTVDLPWMGRRLRDARNRFALPAGVSAANLDGDAATGGAGAAGHANRTCSSRVTWTGRGGPARQNPWCFAVVGDHVSAAAQAARTAWVSSGVAW